LALLLEIVNACCLKLAHLICELFFYSKFRFDNAMLKIFEGNDHQTPIDIVFLFYKYVIQSAGKSILPLLQAAKINIY
jgi:hypothetical protein